MILLIIPINILVNFVLGFHQLPFHLFSPLLGVPVIWRSDGAFGSFFIFFVFLCTHLRPSFRWNF
jgi:hypothetical protein